VSFTGPLLAGRWRLGPRLGQGAQAETFVARDEQKKEGEIVVKRLTLRAWKSFDLFEREARVLSTLRHPGVPRYIASFEEPPGTFNLVMQHMRGQNLRDLTRGRRLSELELRDILVRTLEILDHLHSRVPAVVHRDIKPSNLVRASDGKIALVDFGGVLDAARERGGSTMVGTFGYMAPEQLHGQAMPATDLYALGATIVALAGGIEPEDVPRKGLRMDLARHLPHMDPGLRAALESMTEPDPEKRPQRARDVIAILSKSRPPRELAAALATIEPGAPAKRAPRRIFRGVPEPLGTLMRLSFLMFAVGGWVGMEAMRMVVLLFAYMGSPLAFRKRKQVLGVGRDIAAMLGEGRDGFGDLAARCVAPARRPQLPPGRE
jgi:serine/threonine protein kinase